MTHHPVEKSYEHLPVFTAVPHEVRTQLLAQALTHRSPAGTVLFEQGETPTVQHVVLSGSVHLFARSQAGDEVLIEVVRPGDLVIPAAVVTGSPYLMEARVQEPSRFLLIPAGTFRAAVEREPALAQALIGSLAGQFRRMVRQIKNLKLRSSTQRVGNYILALARQQHDPGTVVLPFEKHLIASELGMTRENFSRTLGALQEHGIKVNGERIIIEDLDRLVAASAPDPLIDTD